METFEQESPIRLDWWQKFFAYWLISWPGVIVVVPFNLVRFHYFKPQPGHFSLPLGLVVLCILQAIQVRRLIRKNFHTFHFGIFRNEGERSRSLSSKEAFSIWLWFVWPEILLAALTTGMVGWSAAESSGTLTQAIYLLSGILHWSIIGPYALNWALRRRYSGFRVEMYGHPRGDQLTGG